MEEAVDVLSGCYENASTYEGNLSTDWIEDGSRDGVLKETLEEYSYQLDSKYKI